MTRIITDKGDLVKEFANSQLDWIMMGHCVNCKGTMNSGFAKHVKDKFPKAYRAYMDHHNSLAGIELGEISYAECEPRKFVVNLHGQLETGRDERQINYEAIYTALEKMKELADTIGIDKVYFPKNMGSNRAGGSWLIIYPMIVHVFSQPSFAGTPSNYTIIILEDNQG